MKYAGILFMSIWFVVQTPLGQLLKLPLLVEHFIKHQQEENASIIDFLAEHYTTAHDDNDAAEDEQLPFKTATFYNLGSALISPSGSPELRVVMIIKEKTALLTQRVPQQHLQRIFHPPRS